MGSRYARCDGRFSRGTRWKKLLLMLCNFQFLLEQRVLCQLACMRVNRIFVLQSARSTAIDNAIGEVSYASYCPSQPASVTSCTCMSSWAPRKGRGKTSHFEQKGSHREHAFWWLLAFCVSERCQQARSLIFYLYFIYILSYILSIFLLYFISFLEFKELQVFKLSKSRNEIKYGRKKG